MASQGHCTELKKKCRQQSVVAGSLRQQLYVDWKRSFQFTMEHHQWRCMQPTHSWHLRCASNKYNQYKEQRQHKYQDGIRVPRLTVTGFTVLQTNNAIKTNNSVHQIHDIQTTILGLSTSRSWCWFLKYQFWFFLFFQVGSVFGIGFQTIATSVLFFSIFYCALLFILLPYTGYLISKSQNHKSHYLHGFFVHSLFYTKRICLVPIKWQCESYVLQGAPNRYSPLPLRKFDIFTGRPACNTAMPVLFLLSSPKIGLIRCPINVKFGMGEWGRNVEIQPQNWQNLEFWP